MLSLNVDPDERIFINYVRNTYGRHLAEILEYNGGAKSAPYQGSGNYSSNNANPSNSVLAFDIPVEDDDEFAMSRHQSETHHYSNQGGNYGGRAIEQPSPNYHYQQLQQQDSGKYHSKGFSRRNL